MVPGTTHLGPSVGPVAHTNETMASPSAQRTVFSGPVTMRKPCMPPGSPFGPGGPRVLADLVHRQDPVGLVAPAWVGRIPRLRVPRRWQKCSIAVASGASPIGGLYCLILSDMRGPCHSTVRLFAQCPLSNNSGQSRCWPVTVCPLVTQSGHAARAARAAMSAFDRRRTLRCILPLLLNGLQGSGQHTPAAPD